MNKIQLEMGDPSSDGHGQAECFNIICNVTQEQLREIYELGVGLGFPDLIDLACTNYEENKLTEEFVDNFLEALETGSSFTGSELEQIKAILDDGMECLESHGFAKLFLTICKAGDPGFEWTEDTEYSTFEIGGYGLFL